jgi:hypothetical protein
MPSPVRARSSPYCHPALALPGHVPHLRPRHVLLFQFKLIVGWPAVGGAYLGAFECCGGFGVEGGAVDAFDGA